MTEELREALKQKGLKVTPQRVAIFEAIRDLGNHPSADNITEYIKKKHPNISVGTVYKVLDCFVANNLLRKVKTEKDIMRYDSVLTPHHHLYCADTDRIVDFEDDHLNQLITNYFKQNEIKNFNIEEIKLQITGTFKTKN